MKSRKKKQIANWSIVRFFLLASIILLPPPIIVAGIFRPPLTFQYKLTECTEESRDTVSDEIIKVTKSCKRNLLAPELPRFRLRLAEMTYWHSILTSLFVNKVGLPFQWRLTNFSERDVMCDVPEELIEMFPTLNDSDIPVLQKGLGFVIRGDSLSIVDKSFEEVGKVLDKCRPVITEIVFGEADPERTNEVYQLVLEPNKATWIVLYVLDILFSIGLIATLRILISFIIKGRRFFSEG